MSDQARPSRRPAFTLAELLVVMAIIALLATITVVAVGAIAKDARIASAKNTIVASLGNARAIAMKDNEVVMVAFRAVPKGGEAVDVGGFQFRVLGADSRRIHLLELHQLDEPESSRVAADG